MEETRNLMPCPIDNKNIMEDALEDSSELFEGFMAAKDHRKNGDRHLVGCTEVYDEEFPNCVDYTAYTDVKWEYAGHMVTIKVLAISACEDFEEVRDEIFKHYKEIFSSWMNEDNGNLVVKFEENKYLDTLYVSFFYDLDKC